jgi:DNA modification methylase
VLELVGMQKAEPDNFDLECTSVWAFPRRGNWATHTSDWRGNWAPEVARNIILRYSNEGETILDPMIGGGTTAIEAKLLNRNIICSDINDIALERTKKSLKFSSPHKVWQKVLKRDARALHGVPDAKVDLVLTHPPYADIIRYSEGKIENDLSNIHDIDAFAQEMRAAAIEFHRVLRPGKFCAILIGDTRRKKCTNLWHIR